MTDRERQYIHLMARARELAEKAVRGGDVPVGALILDPAGQVIGTGYNRREADHNPAGHAEIMALAQAGQEIGSSHLTGCTIIVTLEPCTMCAGAIVLSRLDTLVFGAWDPKTGAAGSIRDVVRDSRANHQIEVIAGIDEPACSSQLTDFFASKR